MMADTERSRRAGEPRRTSVTFYRDQSIHITSHAVQVDGQVIPFDELSRVWYHRDSPSWLVMAGRGALSLTLVAPVVAAVVAFIVALRLDVSGGTQLIIVVVAIMVGLGTALLLDPILDRLDASFDRGVYRHEIWVEHNGIEVRLLQTRDASRFGRIYRALQRAAES